jgi:hypothetical protein
LHRICREETRKNWSNCNFYRKCQRLPLKI